MINPPPDEFESMRKLWNTLCSIESSKGVDLKEAAESWVKKKRHSLSKWEAEGNFEQLCEAGCHPISLAIAIRAIEVSQSMGKRSLALIGSTRRQNRIIHALEKAANILEELHESFGVLFFQDVKELLDKDVRRSIEGNPRLLGTVSAVDFLSLQNAPALNPATTIRVLRAYVQVLRAPQVIFLDIGAHSSGSLPKYIISAYVKEATGQFHDTEVSALIGSALGTGSYDETAHRMWRSRNYRRLDKKNSSLARGLLAIGVITDLNR
jgi:hypothetical protein